MLEISSHIGIEEVQLKIIANKQKHLEELLEEIALQECNAKLTSKKYIQKFNKQRAAFIHDKLMPAQKHKDIAICLLKIVGFKCCTGWEAFKV